MVGGFPIPEVNRLINAFMAGVRETRPDATFQVAFIGSWFDPPKAKETAFAQIEAGADVMYAERFGVSDAAKERGVLAIGNVIDTQPDYPETVVASALWHFEPTLDAAIAAVQAGTFEAADYGVYSFMKHGGCSLAPLGTFEGKVPEEAMTLVAEREAAIKDGSFTVEIDDSEPDVRLTGGVDAPVVLRLDGITKRFGAHARQRRHRLRAATGRGDRAARRERRGQDHADEHPLRPLRRRCGTGRGDGPRAAARQSAGGARGRRRHGAPAFHAGRQPDGAREHRARHAAALAASASARRGAGAHRATSPRRFGLEVDPDARVGDLAVGQRQRVEILKALYRDARILILDEPTAVLTPQETEALFRTLRLAVAEGLSVVFITHKLGEVMAVSDRVLVLRHGRLVGERGDRATPTGTSWRG